LISAVVPWLLSYVGSAEQGGSGAFSMLGRELGEDWYVCKVVIGSSDLRGVF